LKIGGLEVRSTRNVINPDTKLCNLVYAYNKYGKTTLAATLNEMTLRYYGKPTLVVACEVAEGGGTMSIQEFDVPYVTPQSLNDLQAVIAALPSDQTYAGVVLDNATDVVARFVKPYALKFPYSKGTPAATRVAGVPEQGDYQTMGEKMREILAGFIWLTTLPDPKFRKHLVVTATLKDKTDRDGNLICIQPDLPGAMAQTATSMFQTVSSIDVKQRVVEDPAKPGGKLRVTERVLVSSAEGTGKRILGDRTNVFPTEAPLNYCEIWEKWWLPRLNAIKPS
jgi:hypothetical protein